MVAGFFLLVSFLAGITTVVVPTWLYEILKSWGSVIGQWAEDPQSIYLDRYLAQVTGLRFSAFELTQLEKSSEVLFLHQLAGEPAGVVVV